MAEGGREGNMQVGDGGISNTVEVRGFSKKTSQDLMEMYFENSRRSGGGDVEEVTISDEVAYITFKEAEVAQKVASHSTHQVDGHTLTVTLFHPLPPKPSYQNRVLIQGVNNAITEELLRNFLETKTKAQVTEFLYGEEDGNVVVTLSDNIVIDRVLGQSHNVDGVDFEIHLHHECLGRRSSRKKSDLYLRMSSPGNKDSATLEDENADNQANDKTSSSVSSNPENESDFVEVQEWQANDDKSCVLKLLIKYIRSEGVDVEDDTLQDRVQCSFDFQAFWNFYNQTDCGRKMLEAILEKYHCHVSLSKDMPLQGLLVLEIFNQKFHKKSDVKQFVRVLLYTVQKSSEQELLLSKHTVDPRLHKDVLERVRLTKELDSVWIESGGEQGHEICMVYLLEHKMIVLQRMSDIVNAIEESFKNHEELVCVDLMWQRVMIHFGYLQKVNHKFPKLMISCDESINAFVLKGPRDEAKAAANTVLELLETAQREISEVVFSPSCQLEIFTHPEMCAYINRAIPEVAVVWLLNPLTKKIHIFAKDSKQLLGVDKAIRGCVQEKLYPVLKDHSIFYKERARYLEELKKQHTGRLVMHSSTEGLRVTAADDIIEIVDAAIQEIISRERGADQDAHEPEKQDKRDRKPFSKSVPAKTGGYQDTSGLVSMKGMVTDKEIKETVSVANKEIFNKLVEKDLKEFECKGKKLHVIVKEVETETEVGFELEGSTEKEVGDVLQLIKQRIELEKRQLHAQKGIADSTGATASPEEGKISGPNATGKTESNETTGSVFKRIRVKVQKGQLHEAQAEILVNTVDRSLDLTKGVISSSLLEKAGNGIQRELQQYQGKFVFGKVLKTGVGTLPKPSKAIFHGVLYVYEEHSDCVKVFQDFLARCLEDSNKKYRSIAFPPIGTGRLGYPKELVASLLFLSVARFEKAHPTSKLEEVLFVIYEKDQETLKIFEEMHRRCVDNSFGKGTEQQGASLSSSETPIPTALKVKPKTVSVTLSKEDCHICLNKVISPKTLSCGHTFCIKCVESKPACPKCGAFHGIIYGNQPEGGEMKVTVMKYSLNGFERRDTLKIEYRIPRGKQGPNHPEPGKGFDSVYRVAYLPDTREGKKVCNLLRVAFERRLIFTFRRSSWGVGHHVLTWNDIHHKTTLSDSGGQYGYPDSSYLQRVQEQLAAKGITEADIKLDTAL